jgi:hypothetical protein
MQQDLDTHAPVLELVFETVAIDLHLAQPHDGLVIEAVVFRLDFATVLNGLRLRLGLERLRFYSGRLKHKHRRATQDKQDSFHETFSEREIWIELRGLNREAAQKHDSEAGEAVSINYFGSARLSPP